MDEEEKALDVATEAMGRLREHPRGSAPHAEALTVMREAMSEHARLAAARILAEWKEGGSR